MLGLTSNPLLQQIEEASLATRIDWFRDCSTEEWLDFREARSLTREQALHELQKLRFANVSTRRFDLQDYHALLLHGAMFGYTNVHNDCVKDIGGPRELGPFLLGEIDFDGLVDWIFWDDDFLLPPKLTNTPMTKAAAGISMQAVSIANGLPAHPEELVLRERPEDCQWEDFVRHYVPGERFPSECQAPEAAQGCVAACLWNFEPDGSVHPKQGLSEL